MRVDTRASQSAELRLRLPRPLLDAARHMPAAPAGMHVDPPSGRRDGRPARCAGVGAQVRARAARLRRHGRATWPARGPPPRRPRAARRRASAGALCRVRRWRRRAIGGVAPARGRQRRAFAPRPAPRIGGAAGASAGARSARALRGGARADTAARTRASRPPRPAPGVSAAGAASLRLELQLPPAP